MFRRFEMIMRNYFKPETSLPLSIERSKWAFWRVILKNGGLLTANIYGIKYVMAIYFIFWMSAGASSSLLTILSQMSLVRTMMLLHMTT